MSINSKAKGSGFELKIAKKLTEWSGHKFHRTPMSGALHWENDKRVLSDIVPPHEINWPFSIECKKVEYDWDFSFIMKGTSTFWEHWKQATDDASREDMIPMLVFSKNYRDNYVAITVDVFVKLFYNKKKPTYISVVYYTDTISYNVVILNFDSFLLSVSLDEVLDMRLI